MVSYMILFALAASIGVTSACQAKVDPSRILRPAGKCPSGHTYRADNGGNTCCCSDYCCWDNCRRDHAPEGKCVDVSVNGERSTTWTYDGGKKFWVLLEGPKFSLVPKKPALDVRLGLITIAHLLWAQLAVIQMVVVGISVV